ncbi:MAG TPA: ParB/RepB/Spo0J family partition protein [Candidatus Bathyarchaeia archaeon]|nr:ParB/RepB/Spo0J family partition protein [Candidatus Bathyarchaeia archaeon]
MVEQELREVELKKIRPNRLNPRLDINIERLNELAESIKQIGVLEPLILRPTSDGYEVVVGERRYRAAQQAKLETVPAIIRKYADEQVIELNLIENVQREELSAVEKGNCCRQLIEKYPEKYASRQEIGNRIGISQETISTWLKLTGAPAELQRMIAPAEKAGVPRELGTIDYSTAAAITRQIPEPERQIEVAKEIAQKPVYGKEAKEVIKKAAKEPRKPARDVVKEIVEAPADIMFRLAEAESVQKGLKAQITQKRAPDPKIKPGARVTGAVLEPHFIDLRIISVERKRLKYFSSEDSKKEGGYTLEEFKKQWKDRYGEWNENELVYIVHFEKT